MNPWRFFTVAFLRRQRAFTRRFLGESWSRDRIPRGGKASD
jgi:hypothetical protein